MSTKDDLAIIVAQERALVFPEFSEAIAFELGSAIRARGLADGASLAIDIRTGQRPLFYAALAGTSADHPHWLRRKANLTQRVGKSSYRVALELENRQDIVFGPFWNLDPADYVLAGGSFPIVVRNAGLIGAVTLSGTNDRDEHARAAAGIGAWLGVDMTALTLSAR
jgi:uncharacterized protein (UPF0303 family)